MAQLVLIMSINILSQENEFYYRQMLSDEERDVAAEWSRRGDVRMLQQQLLDRLSTSNTPRPCWT